MRVRHPVQTADEENLQGRSCYSWDMGCRERRSRIGICPAMGALGGSSKPSGNRRNESILPWLPPRRA
jgi:hypothetical protein